MRLVDKLLQAGKFGVAIVKSSLRKRRDKGGPAPKPLPKGEERDYTLAELAAFDGSDSEKPLLLAVKGKVYDVTYGRDFYGPGGPYGMFSGKDCSRALALLSFELGDFIGDLSGLDEVELGQLEDWVETFDGKYRTLGALIEDQGAKPS